MKSKTVASAVLETLTLKGAEAVAFDYEALAAGLSEDNKRQTIVLESCLKRIAELEGALRHAMKFEDALREIAHGNWSNVKPDSQAASDLSQIVAEMQRIASEAIR